MTNAAILLALAAGGGLVMLVMRLRGAPYPPMWLAVVHGIIAASGLAMLVYAYMQGPLPSAANWALVAFVLAGLGGAVLFFGFHLRRRALPIAFVLGHGLIAGTGLGLLLSAIYA